MFQENWKPITGYEGIYDVSDQGRVRRIKTGHILKPRRDKHGYYLINLYKEGPRTYLVNRLVLKAFAGLPKPGKICNHKDGVKTNNKPDNLERVTHKENCLHACRVLGKGRGELHSQAKLANKDIPIIRRLLVKGKLTAKQIGEMFGVGETAIYNIKHHRKWTHIQHSPCPT